MSTLVLPGFANVHSHAFQRLLRGEVQHRDPTREDTFWTWREAMYSLANRVDLDAIEAAARLTYVEGLEGGYTAVGEFHYLHHAPDGSPWADPTSAARAHLRAARQAGIRLTLIHTVYVRGGFGKTASDGQRRFLSKTLDEVDAQLERLASLVDGTRTRLGLAIHSVRAVPEDWLGPLGERARALGLPLHVHAAEQTGEVDQCRAATGLTPVGLLARHGVLSPRTTLVHGTWLDDDDVALIAESGATVALCPTTEADLGDGIPRVADLFARGVPLAIGTDSHVVLDPFVELRQVESLARLATRKRCVLADDTGAIAPVLQRIGTAHGYRCLDLDATGDSVTLDTSDRVFEGTRDHHAVALTSGHRGLVTKVTVAGEAVVDGGRWLG